VPVGIPAELYVGGDGLARGYLNNPAMTAEAFLPHPWATAPGARVYRTGDLARHLPDGTLLFLGRRDHQVKIRGFRIELGEIEAALGRHPAIRAAVVAVHEDRPGDTRLMAYVVAAEGPAPSASELRRHLREVLPEYMLPAWFVFLETLPVTPTGKVDRQALTSHAPARAGLDGTFVPPRDALESRLAQIWEEVLGTRPVGVKDSFFDLGGNSLLAVRLLAHVEALVGAEIPVASLFQSPTVEHLASVLRRQGTSVSAPSLVPIQPHGSRPAFFCVHPGGGIVSCYVDVARHLGSDQPFFGLQSQGLYGEQALLTRVETMAAHYVDELRGVQPEGPYFLGGWSMGGLVAFEMAHQLEAQGHEVALLALLDTKAPGGDDGTAAASRAAIIAQFAEDHGLDLSRERLMQMEPDDALDYALEQAQAADLLPADIDPPRVRRHLSHLLSVYETNWRASHQYVARPYPKRVTLLRASDPPVEAEGDRELGWGTLVAGVDLHVVPGRHVTMVREPHARALADRLAACIGDAIARRT
jgi:thioesterase domain-containing protein/acyl carrier protein